MKFKVGDTVRGNSEASVHSDVICEGWEGIVIRLDIHYFEARTTKPVTEGNVIGDNYMLKYSCFDLVRGKLGNCNKFKDSNNV